MKPTEILKVSAAPINIIPGHSEQNLAAAGDAVAALSPTSDIIVLPELFSTGYTNDGDTMRSMAEPADGATMEAVKAMACGSGCAIAGSFAAIEHDGRMFNRAFFVTPDRQTVFYDKRHLFSMSNEAAVFGSGSAHIPVINHRGWNIAMSVCYDLRFPAWMRNRSYAYDLMLLPANWPQARVYALEHLLIARAIENQAPIVCANRSGSDAYGCYDGCSFAFDHMGRQAFAPGSTTASFDLSAIRRARSRFPAACDADEYAIRL